MKKIPIEENKKYKFISRTKRLGCAEFIVCPVFKYRKLVNVYVYPKQQENRNYFYVWEGEARGLWLTGYEGLGDPNVWQTFYCKEHKCHSLEMYVPVGSNYISFTRTVDTFQISFWP